MPGYKIGRLWKLKKDEIDEWVRKGKAIDTGDRKKLNFLDFFKRLTLPKRISSIGVIGDLITYQEESKSG